MKPEKVFVRYKNLNEQPPHPKERNEKRTYEKKKYAQKHIKTRQPFKVIYESFIPTTDPNPHVQKLCASFPTFFSNQGKPPEKENNQLLTDYLIFNTKKFLQSLKQPKKEVEHISSSDPDWNTDEEFDCNMQSKVIEEAVINKVADKLKDKPINKIDTLKPHEKRFLQDYFRAKRQQQQEDSLSPVKIQQKHSQSSKEEKKSDLSPGKTAPEQPKNKSKQEQKPKLVWTQYQEKQINTFVDMGFMTKIEENDQEMPIEVIEDDDLFNEEEFKNQSSAKSSSSSSDEEEDDIFGDEGPSTTIRTKKQEQLTQPTSEKKITQGTVVVNAVNENIFRSIAEAVRLDPKRCKWIIKNDTTKYKVDTDYMDAYYRKENMYLMFPLVSLNHSPFVNNSEIGTPEALDRFRNFNYRRIHQKHYPQPQRAYKEKHTHLNEK